MKKMYGLFLCLVMCFSFSVNTQAASQTISATEVFSDGSYIETTIVEDTTIVPFASSIKSGKKTSTYKDSAGSVLWSITVHGKFSYNGSSSTCISSKISTTCSNSYWKLSNKSSSKAGATAKASVTAKRYMGNTLAQVLKRSVSLTCSKKGVLS